MKDFVKYTLATLCGLFLAGIALFILGILSIAGMMTVESAAPSIKPQSVLRLTLNGELQEDAPNNPLGDLFGSAAQFLDAFRQVLCIFFADIEVAQYGGSAQVACDTCFSAVADIDVYAS